MAGCGGDKPLLARSDVTEVVYGTGASKRTNYGPTSMAEGVRGALQGRVSFQGDPFSMRAIQLSDDFCVENNQGELVPESFLLSPDGSLAGVIVYVKRGLNKQKWPVPDAEVVLDQINCRYVPHLAVVQVGQPLLIKSSDKTLHNVHGLKGPNPDFNESMPKPGVLPVRTFAKPEVCKKIVCDVHGWMSCFVAILPHPFHAITGEDGTFRIEGVPPGKYELAFWHEKLGEQTVEVDLGDNETLTQDHNFTRTKG
jgi:hypothetical protein